MGGAFRDRTKMGSPILPLGFTGDQTLESAVREAGGWEALARADEQQMAWKKKAFLAAFSTNTQYRGAAHALGLADADGRLLSDGDE